MNSKSLKQRLVSDLLEYWVDYSQCIPFYCRLVATLAKYIHDLPKTFSNKALEEYLYLTHNSHETTLNLDKKTRYLLYIIELTKFNLIQTSVILNILSKYYIIIIIIIIIHNNSKYWIGNLLKFLISRLN